LLLSLLGNCENNKPDEKTKPQSKGKTMPSIAVSRFRSPDTGREFAIDWCSVVAMEQNALQISIHFKHKQDPLAIRALTEEQNSQNFEMLYNHWEMSFKRVNNC
jgi:hypothetical protein